jgi:hypothetical protein
LEPFQDLSKLFQALLNHIEMVLGHLRPFGAIVWSFLAVSDVFGAVSLLSGSFVCYRPFRTISDHFRSFRAILRSF